MNFIRLTLTGSDEKLVVLNTAYIAQVMVNTITYNTTITMADGEEIEVEEDLPTVLAMLQPAPDLDKGLMAITIEQLKIRLESADKLIEDLQAVATVATNLIKDKP